MTATGRLLPSLLNLVLNFKVETLSTLVYDWKPKFLIVMAVSLKVNITNAQVKNKINRQNTISGDLFVCTKLFFT